MSDPQSRFGITAPKAAHLDMWVQREWTEGVQLDEMPVLSKIVVQTENSLYELTVLNASRGEVLIRGGRFFPEWVSARLSGASLGGSLLKLHGIYIGFSMELLHAIGTVITSPVAVIAVQE